MRFRLIVAGIAGILSATPAFADLVNSQHAKITMIRGFNALNSKGVYFQIDAPIPNPAGCANSSMIRAASTEIADFDQQFSMLLTAFASGNTVMVQVSDSQCSGGWPLFANIYVYQ
jgi:hypothetical protein